MALAVVEKVFGSFTDSKAVLTHDFGHFSGTSCKHNTALLSLCKVVLMNMLAKH